MSEPWTLSSLTVETVSPSPALSFIQSLPHHILICSFSVSFSSYTVSSLKSGIVFSVFGPIPSTQQVLSG